MTDAEIVANLFGCPPCEFSPIDEEMDGEECERICGSDEQTDAKCWQRYFDLKRKEDKNEEIHY